MDYCPHCRIFTRFFLGRHLRIQHLNYIPLKTWVLDYAEFCDQCKRGRVFTQEAYAARMKIMEPFSDRRLQKRCYEKALSLADGAAATDASAAEILDALSAEFPIRTSPQLDEIYRRRIEMLLA